MAEITSTPGVPEVPTAPEALEAPAVHKRKTRRQSKPEVAETVVQETPIQETPLQEIPAPQEVTIMAPLERDRGGAWPGIAQTIPGTITNVLGSFVTIPLMRVNRKMARLMRAMMLLGAATPWIYPLVLRPRHLRWGATDDEVNEPMPGDQEVAHPMFESTRAVTIDAPVEEVWPWLVQIGYNRGGFYSYSWLENMAAHKAGLASGYTSVDYILPEFQDLKVGDDLPLAERMALKVTALDPHRYIVLAAHGAPLMDKTFSGDFSWVWLVKPVDDNTTRLVMRFRASLDSEKAIKSTGIMMEPVHFIMERKMLLSIKERAERIY